MKVIAIGRRGFVMVEMSDGELSDLVGAPLASHHSRNNGSQRTVEPGETYDIRAAWEVIHRVQGAPDRMARFVSELTGMADDTEAMIERLQGLIDPEQKGDES